MLLLVALAAFMSGAASADDGPSKRTGAPEDAAPPPAFGTDVTVGVGAGALLGAWPDAGLHGTLGGRVDLFMVSRDTPGPRLGASLWGRTAVWPLQTATSDDSVTTPFGLTQYGAGVVMRFDPTTRFTGTFGFGFGRTDLDGYQGGVWAIPTFTVEAGVRQSLGILYIDYGAQGGWGSARGPSTDWEDWWTVGAGIGVGLHAR
ncbi:MAG: hypothetical protein V4850_18125 [Myxococcota bacterium]